MKDLELQMDLSESAGTTTDNQTELRYNMEEGHIVEEDMSQQTMSEQRSVFAAIPPPEGHAVYVDFLAEEARTEKSVTTMDKQMQQTIMSTVVVSQEEPLMDSVSNN